MTVVLPVIAEEGVSQGHPQAPDELNCERLPSEGMPRNRVTHTAEQTHCDAWTPSSLL